ncbi:MAG TPA: BatD family protein [Chryseolinea sp.]
MKRLFLILSLLVSLYQVNGQSCFARVQLDHRSVYVQQPFKVTITVLTATWYTAPIEFDNLQVPNAFVLPFDRTFPGMFEHNGKQYAGIQFYFIVFPYRAGKFTLPAITVHATTPPEGSSESRRITIKTPAQHFTVKTVPDNEGGTWFVAKSVAIHEHWNKSLSNLKVGDIIERTVRVRANGTLPQFIPALTEKKLDFANVYPQDPELKDLRTEYDANGELTQSFIYLLEKEGDFVIPPMPVRWWNPNVRKIQTRSLRQHALHVKANPDLGMVATIRDSLEVAQQGAPTTLAKKEPLMIMGIHWYWFALYALASLIILYALIRLLVKVSRSLYINYVRYRSSEQYWFRHLMSSPASQPIFWQRLYQWWDHMDQVDKTPDILETATEYADPSLEKMLQDTNERLYFNGNDADKINGLRKRIKSFRRWLRHEKAKENRFDISERQKEWRG